MLLKLHYNLRYYLQASDYLGIQELLELACHTLANKIKGKSPQEIRRIFNSRNGSTQDEEDVDELCTTMVPLINLLFSRSQNILRFLVVDINNEIYDHDVGYVDRL